MTDTHQYVSNKELMQDIFEVSVLIAFGKELGQGNWRFRV
jgi:hypothetical protein